MLYPYLIYLFLENTYSKRVKGITRKEKKQTIISNSILCVVIISAIMLISCQFRFGILVIGSESMTGTINVGDAVVYEQYEETCQLDSDATELRQMSSQIQILQISALYIYYQILQPK